MNALSTVREVLAAAELLYPVVDEVAHWLAGRGDREPLVISQLPIELRSDAALQRARARSGASHSVDSARPPGVPGAGV